MTAASWISDAVVYQIFPDRFANGDPSNDPPGVAQWAARPTRENFFGGDLRGLLQRLDYLEDLGIGAIYLTPIFAAGTNHRYDTHDYLAVDARLGDVGLLRELVRDAHGRGIRVLLDGVFNHAGDGFWAFRDVREHGAESRYRDWFTIDRLPIETDPPSYQTCGGTHYLPKLNLADPDLREYLLQVGTHWIEAADIDGWRLDVPWKAPLDFWHEFRTRVKEVKPDAYLVAEAWWSWGDLLEVFDGVMNYRLRGRILDFCVDDSIDAEDFVVEARLLYREAGEALLLNLLGSHDTPRLLTLARGDERKASLALVALMTMPGTPMVYYGDELGLEGDNDPDCRRTMPWDKASSPGPLYTLVRRLIDLRGEHSALRHGTWEPLLVFNRLLAYRRVAKDDEVLVILNPGDDRRDVAIPTGGITSWHDALGEASFPMNDGVIGVPSIESRGFLVLTRPNGAARAPCGADAD